MPSDQTGLKSNDPSTIINKRKNPPSGLLKFPANLGVHSTLMRFFKYSYGGVRGSEITGSVDIVLPLPKQIQDSFKINVAGDEIGAISAGAAQVLAAGGDMDSLVGDAGASTAKSIIDAVSGGGGIGQLGTDMIQMGLSKSNPNISNMMRSGKGNALNPFATLVFKGVDLKVHSLEWMLSPDSEQESATLKDIIKNLQSMVLPTVGGIGAGGDLSAIERGLLRYPHMVDVYFQGIDMNYYFKFKTSMISQISVDYTPNGIAINKGGRPSAIRLTMTLQEAFIHTADDYETGEIEVAASPESTGSASGNYPYVFGSGTGADGDATSSDDGSITNAYAAANGGILWGGGAAEGNDSPTDIITVGGVASTRATLNSQGITDDTIANSPELYSVSGVNVADIVAVNGVPRTRGDLNAEGVTDETIANNESKYSVTSKPAGGSGGGSGGGSPWPKFAGGTTSNSPDGQSKATATSNGLLEDEVFVVNASGDGGYVVSRAVLNSRNITDETIASNSALYITGTDSVLPSGA